jgi:hypothetical protein
MQGREMALPEDIQAVGVAVMGHRLGPGGFDGSSESGRIVAERLLRTVPVP